MEGVDGLLVADLPLPSPDRAEIRLVRESPAYFVAAPVRSQELPENLMGLALTEARDFQITFRLRRDAFAPLAVLPRWYPDFPSCIVVAFVKPEDIVDTTVEVGRLGRRIVVIQVVGEGHHEQCPVDVHQSGPSSQNA